MKDGPWTPQLDLPDVWHTSRDSQKTETLLFCSGSPCSHTPPLDWVRPLDPGLGFLSRIVPLPNYLQKQVLWLIYYLILMAHRVLALSRVSINIYRMTWHPD